MHGIDEFERVPDSYGGDFGIEAFTFAGVVYQCYADQASNTKKERYEKQRDKLTEDIRTFCNNAQGIQALLGAQKVRRWHFVVPRLEHKDLLKHARAKTQEVRKQCLPHVANDFEIVILDRNKLAPWERQLEKTKVKLRMPPVDLTAVSDHQAHTSVEGDQLRNIYRKIGRAYAFDDSEQVQRRVTEFLKTHVIGENRLRELAELSPQTYQTVRADINAKQLKLSTVGASGPNPLSILDKELDELKATIACDASELDADIVTCIALSAVTTWLLLCPLDF